MRRYFMATLCLILSICFVATGTACSSEKAGTSDAKEIENVIETYDSRSYDAWWNLEYIDLSDLLDMDSIQCYNKVSALKENIETWKYAIEQGYYKGTRERFSLDYDFTSVQVDGATAVAHVTLSTPPDVDQPVYPFFICLGENTFSMVKKNGSWLISGHEYNDWCLYEHSLTEKYEVPDLSEIHERVDEDYR